MNRFVNDHRTEAWLIASIEKCMAINIKGDAILDFLFLAHKWFGFR